MKYIIYSALNSYIPPGLRRGGSAKSSGFFVPRRISLAQPAPEAFGQEEHVAALPLSRIIQLSTTLLNP